MKYMTKEWYETMQKTHLHFSLKVSKKAEEFSDANFKELYTLEEKEWVELQRETYDVQFEKIFPKEFCARNVDGTPLDQEVFEKARAEYLGQREKIRYNFLKRPPFNPEKERKIFKQMFRNKIKYLTNILPNKIIQKVADIRVLALDYASDDNKKEITKYCEDNEKATKEAISAYKRYYDSNIKDHNPVFDEKVLLHDCIIESCRKKGKDLLLKIDNTGELTDICELRFKNCIVVKQDKPLNGARYLYEEVYKRGKQYEFHFLLEKNELIDFIVSAENVEFKYDQ